MVVFAALQEQLEITDIMMRMDLAEKRLVDIPTLSLQELNMLERRDLQEMVCNSFPVFANELGLGELLFVGKEVEPSDKVGDRIDVLALGKDAQPVVVELKRGKDESQLRQVLAYGGMIADWNLDMFIREISRRLAVSYEEAERQIREHVEIDLETELDKFNTKPKLVLVAEQFHWQILSAVRWLHEDYGVQLHCFLMKTAQEGDLKLLDLQQVFPVAGLEHYAANVNPTTAPQRLSSSKPPKQEILRRIDNDALHKFVEKEIERGVRWNEVDRLFYPIGGVIRFNFNIRRLHGGIWQRARFKESAEKNDIQFWSERLGPDAKVRPTSAGCTLSFELYTQTQLEQFKQAVEKTIKPEWFL